jgi:hypothetical protein
LNINQNKQLFGRFPSDFAGARESDERIPMKFSLTVGHSIYFNHHICRRLCDACEGFFEKLRSADLLPLRAVIHSLTDCQYAPLRLAVYVILALSLLINGPRKVLFCNAATESELCALAMQTLSSLPKVRRRGRRGAFAT